MTLSTILKDTEVFWRNGSGHFESTTSITSVSFLCRPLEIKATFVTGDPCQSQETDLECKSSIQADCFAEFATPVQNTVVRSTML